METKPAIEASLVQQFVANAHGDLDRVKELMAREPALINAGWDWDDHAGNLSRCHMNA